MLKFLQIIYRKRLRLRLRLRLHKIHMLYNMFLDVDQKNEKI